MIHTTRSFMQSQELQHTGGFLWESNSGSGEGDAEIGSWCRRGRFLPGLLVEDFGCG